MRPVRFASQRGRQHWVRHANPIDQAVDARVCLVRHNTSGVLQFQVDHPIIDLTPQSTTAATSIALDTANRVAVVRFYILADVGRYSATTGAKGLSIASPIPVSETQAFTSVTCDASDNIIACRSQPASGTSKTLYKWNSAGTLQWSIDADYCYSVVTDSTGNVYAIRETGPFPGSGLKLTKWNSSGTHQWDQTLSYTGNANQYGLHIDASDVLCIPTGTGTSHVIKEYDTSGTNTGNTSITLVSSTSTAGFVWANANTYAYAADRTYSIDRGTASENWNAAIRGGSYSPRQVLIDGSDNVYCVENLTTASAAGRLRKFNNVGTEQFDVATLRTQDGYQCCTLSDSEEPVIGGERRDRL